MSLPKELIGDGGCILGDVTSRLELYSKPIKMIQ